ncbi:MAG: hypothetical protein ACR2QF_10215 [Geminicoccaceae bacterium]
MTWLEWACLALLSYAALNAWLFFFKRDDLEQCFRELGLMPPEDKGDDR